MMLSSLVVAIPAFARHSQCPALLTDGECDQLETIMMLRDKQPEEYGLHVEFAKRMTERHQVCVSALIKWADSVHDGFRPRQITQIFMCNPTSF